MKTTKKDFIEYINKTSLSAVDKETLLSIPEYFEGNFDPLFASKTFLLKGDPGIGKTHSALWVLRSIDVPIVYCGAGKLKIGKKYSSLKEMNKNLKDQDCIVFLDDLNFVVDIKDYEVDSEHSRQLMHLLETVRNSKNKMILVATANTMGMFDEAIIDRFDYRITFDFPSVETKKEFLECRYGNKFNRLFDHIAANTIGYNYRDIEEMLRIAYRTGKCKVTKESLTEALKNYDPTALDRYSVLRSIDQRFTDVVGRSGIKSQIQRLVKTHLNQNLSREMGVKRSNLIMFYGPPGTGKTLMAKALAGEVGYPLVQVNAARMLRYGFNSEIKNLKRYSNCIIFIDEAEKLFGRGRMNVDDHPFLAEVHTTLDGVESDVNALVIFAINDHNCFGPTIKDRFSPVYFKLPEAKERLDFIKMKYGSVENRKFALNDKIITKHTEGMSFRELEKIWNEMVIDYIDTQTLPSDETFKEAVARVKNQYTEEPEKVEMFG